MKQVIVICDGMADEPLEALGGKTPMEAADTPAMDQLAQKGRTGSLRTIPDGKYPGSEVGIMTILGYAPQQLPWGRGALEAIGLDMALNPDEIAMRYILNSPEEFNHADLAKQLSAGKTHPLSDTTGLCIVPYTYSECRTNRFVRFWSRDRLRSFPTFVEIHSSHFNTSHTVAIVGAVPLLRGIALAVGADWIKPEGATGDLSTDFEAKGAAAIKALETHDTVIVHIEACDWASHHKDPMAKMKAIENIDKHIISPLIYFLYGLYQCNSEKNDFSIAVMSDHPSLCSTGNHTSGPSPFLYYYPHIIADETKYFTEREAFKGNLKSIEEIWIEG